MSNYWGYHLSVDASGASLAAISDAKVIEAFVKELIEEIDMVAYGEPLIVRFGSGNKMGYTLCQLIETSNICVHFVENDGTNSGFGSYYADIFSCKTFNNDDVIKCLRKYFGNTSERIHYSVRQA